MPRKKIDAPVILDQLADLMYRKPLHWDDAPIVDVSLFSATVKAVLRRLPVVDTLTGPMSNFLPAERVRGGHYLSVSDWFIVNTPDDKRYLVCSGGTRYARHVLGLTGSLYRSEQ